MHGALNICYQCCIAVVDSLFNHTGYSHLTTDYNRVLFRLNHYRPHLRGSRMLRGNTVHHRHLLVQTKNVMLARCDEVNTQRVGSR